MRAQSNPCYRSSDWFSPLWDGQHSNITLSCVPHEEEPSHICADCSKNENIKLTIASSFTFTLDLGENYSSCLINFYTHLYMFVVLSLQTDPLGVFKSHICVILSYTVWAAHESSSVFCLKTQKIKNVALLQGNSHPCWMCMQTLWTVWTSTLSWVTLSPQPLSIKATFVVIQVEPTPSPK